MNAFDTYRPPPAMMPLILDGIGDGVLVLDAAWRIALANPAASRLLGCGAGLAGRRLDALVIGIKAFAEAAGRDGGDDGGWRSAILSPVAPVEPVTAVIRHWTGPEGGWLVLLRPAAGPDAGQACPRSRDPLTGLLNRAAFLDHLDQTLALAAPGAAPGVLVAGIDRFGGINQTLGQAGGDGVLVAFARALQGLMPEPGVVARLGACSFGLLPCAAADSGEVLDRLVRRLAAEPFDFGRAVPRRMVAASVGMARRSRDGETAAELLAAAEAAMPAGGPGADTRR